MNLSNNNNATTEAGFVDSNKSRSKIMSTSPIVVKKSAVHQNQTVHLR